MKKETIYGPRKLVICLLAASILYALAVFLFAIVMSRTGEKTIGHFLFEKRSELILAIVVFVSHLVALLGGQTFVQYMQVTKYRVIIVAFETTLIAALLYAFLPYPWWPITFTGLLFIISVYEFIRARRAKVGSEATLVM